MRWLLCLLLVGCHDEFRETATGYAVMEYEVPIGSAAVELPIEIEWEVVDDEQITIPVTIIVNSKPTSDTGTNTLELWPDPAVGQPFMTSDASAGAFREAKTERTAPGTCEGMQCSVRYIARWRRVRTTDSVRVNYIVNGFSQMLFEDQADLDVRLAAPIVIP